MRKLCVLTIALIACLLIADTADAAVIVRGGRGRGRVVVNNGLRGGVVVANGGFGGRVIVNNGFGGFGNRVIVNNGFGGFGGFGFGNRVIINNGFGGFGFTNNALLFNGFGFGVSSFGVPAPAFVPVGGFSAGGFIVP